jgi:hypothetical protein
MSPIAAAISRPVVLARATWKPREDGRGLRADRGTWCPLKGEQGGGSVIVPLLSCPSCEQVTVLVPDMRIAGMLRRMGLPFPVGHDDHPPLFDIDRLGKVTAKSFGPEFACAHKTCSFRRRIYLDKWQHEKPLWVVAYIEPPALEPEFTYCHASSRVEAIHHFGAAGNRRIIDAGPAVGFFTNEQTGAQHA